MYTIHIDLGYLMKRKQDIGVDLDFEKFRDELIKELGLSKKELLRTYIYTASPPMKDTEGYNRFVKFVDWLRNHGFEVRIGKLKPQGDRYVQKMVDILLTIDCIHLSLSPKVDTIYVITGDDDFVPVFQTVKNNGTKVILLYNRIAGSDLKKEADECIEIEDIMRKSVRT